MSGWSALKKKFSLEVSDLPNQQGATVVVIEKFDTERYTAVNPETKQPEAMQRHRMFFVGFEHPLRLNNTRVATLEAMFGGDPNDAIGRKVCLLVGTVTKYGKPELDIMIHPHAPDESTPTTEIPASLACTKHDRLLIAMQAGIKIAKASTQLPSGLGAPAPTTPSSAVSGPMGKDAAAELLMLLKERARDWEWLCLQLGTRNLGQHVHGRMPFDCDASVKGPAWSMLKDLPIVDKGFDRAKAKAAILTSWQPRPEVIDKTTGEVIKPADPPLNPDDIPF